jgi:hypothetical protein
MPVKTVVGGRLEHFQEKWNPVFRPEMRQRKNALFHIALLAAAIAGVLLLAGALDVAFAQGSPFGGPRPQAAPPMGGVLGWIFAKQAEF